MATPGLSPPRTCRGATRRWASSSSNTCAVATCASTIWSRIDFAQSKPPRLTGRCWRIANRPSAFCSSGREWPAPSAFLSVLPAAGFRIFINAGRLTGRRVFEDLVRGLEDALLLASIPPIPDEVPHDGEDDDDPKDHRLDDRAHRELRSMMAAVP